MNNHTILNYELMRTAALDAVQQYPKPLAGDRDGLYHGTTGEIRATKAPFYLNNSRNNPAAILATLLAIFGKPNAGFFNWVPGRSTRLAGHIADAFISGSYEQGAVNNDSLTSQVFSSEALAAAKTKNANFRVIPNGENSWQSFDNTYAVRFLLQKALQEFPAEERNVIQIVARNIRRTLESKESAKMSYLSALQTIVGQSRIMGPDQSIYSSLHRR